MCVGVCVGLVTAVLTVIRLFCRQDVSLVLRCACEGECVAVLRHFVSDTLHFTLIMYNRLC